MRPSLLKSAHVAPLGWGVVAMFASWSRVPGPEFWKIVAVLESKLAEMRSRMSSPLQSAALRPCGLSLTGSEYASNGNSNAATDPARPARSANAMAHATEAAHDHRRALRMPPRARHWATCFSGVEVSATMLQ